MSVDTEIQCNNVHIGNGSISVAPHAHFSIKGAVTIHRTFAEKGKWYFISFPFDVYPDGIDAGFQLKDDTFKGGGNVFYLKTYNGEKRATGNTKQGNWETLPATAINNNEPIFEKNKGYLIALDAAATSQTLRFSSKEADIPTDFGKSGTISVRAFPSQSPATNEHSGWHLCGNPLSGTLSLSQIEPNPALDGNIYLYNGSSYTAYAIGSNYALPPFTAFFVKASADTELKINPTPSSANEYLLYNASLPIQRFDAEPSADIKTSQHPLSAIKSQLIGNKLHLSNMSEPAHVRIIAFGGQLVYSRPVAAGSSFVSLSQLKEGLYVLDIETANQHIRQKFIRKE